MAKSTIALDVLRLSIPVKHDINRPKALWEILDDVHKVLKENKINFIQDDIHCDLLQVYNPNTKKYLSKQGEEDIGSIDKYVFEELYTRIVIVDELHEMEGAIMLAYNKFGVQVAFGLTYHERSSVALLGEENTFMSSSACGDIKVMQYFAMVHKVKQWFPVSNRNVLEQLERSRAVMNKSLNVTAMHKFVERFVQYSGKYNDCIADNGMVGPVALELFAESIRESIHNQFSRMKNYSAWDLFNAGNVILRPEGEISLHELIPLGYFWGGYVFSRLT
jgi:hypothetical protein